jgi:hypothetical protein
MRVLCVAAFRELHAEQSPIASAVGLFFARRKRTSRIPRASTIIRVIPFEVVVLKMRAFIASGTNSAPREANAQ